MGLEGQESLQQHQTRKTRVFGGSFVAETQGRGRPDHITARRLTSQDWRWPQQTWTEEAEEQEADGLRQAGAAKAGGAGQVPW